MESYEKSERNQQKAKKRQAQQLKVQVQAGRQAEVGVGGSRGRNR